MKHLRLDRWAFQLQPPRNPRLPFQQQRCLLSDQTTSNPRTQLQQRQCQAQAQWRRQTRHAASRRKASSAAAVQVAEDVPSDPPPGALTPDLLHQDIRMTKMRLSPDQPLNAPSHKRAVHSAKLSALHARLSLPTQLPLQTLARCLIDSSVDHRPGFNNAPLAILGQDLLGYYTSEHLICNYPRLPMPVLFAAHYAYVGPATLAALRGEWGVEVVGAPGPEVDPGLLQLKKTMPTNAMSESGILRSHDLPQLNDREHSKSHYRRGFGSRIVFDDQFGDPHSDIPSPDEVSPYSGAPISTAAKNSEASFVSPTNNAHLTASVSRTSSHSPTDSDSTSIENASMSFVRALVGALYLHAGSSASKAFHRAHILSRHLELHKLFHFTHPTRDLSFLCRREGFEPPVARMISETGRLSRSPVFIVGVFSGNDKLGEGAGSSLNEGRVRAAAAALRSWYLYSPPDPQIMFPSDLEGTDGPKKTWKAQMIDMGEITT